MATVTIYSDVEAQENEICPCFHFSPSIYCEMMGLYAFEELSLLCLCHNIVDFMPTWCFVIFFLFLFFVCEVDIILFYFIFLFFKF